jgi:hypothetical protein
VGKAVVCACGHKFLVPPGEGQTPPPPAAPQSPQPRVAAAPRSAPPRRQPRQAPGGDSSAEALPLAEPLGPAPPATRWTDPIDDHESAPIIEAEVVQPDIPFAEPVAPPDGLFGAGGAYSVPVAAGAYAPPRKSPLRPPKPPKKRKKSAVPPEALIFFACMTLLAVAAGYSKSPLLTGLLVVACGAFTVCGAANDWEWFMNHHKARLWLAMFGRTGTRIFYGILGSVLVVMGVLIALGLIKNEPRRQRSTWPQPKVKKLLSPVPLTELQSPSSPQSGFAPTTGEPAPSGYPITLWNAVRQGRLGEFSVEYRIDRGPFDTSRQY